MAAEKVDAPYILLVHTNKYSGNFERQMCAFMTGITGDCEVGSEEAERFKEDMTEKGLDPDLFDGYLDFQSDDHGDYRPASIWDADESGNYNTVAIFFCELPDADQTVLLRERAYEYAAENKIIVLKLSMISREVKVIDEEIEF